jgi:hypothetical protein
MSKTLPKVVMSFAAWTETSVHFISSCKVPMPNLFKSFTSIRATSSASLASKIALTRSE